MEICYYWSEKLGYNKHNKGFNFGSGLHFSYNFKDKKLTIKEDDLYINNFFNAYNDEKISNITAVVGRNGVGKSTFLEEIKSLYVQKGIVAYKNEKRELENHKKILVIKNKNKYEIVYHRDLLLIPKNSYTNNENINGSSKLANLIDVNNPRYNIKANISFIGDNLEKKYIFLGNIYFDNVYNNTKDMDFVRNVPDPFIIKNHSYLTDTSCIYFSYAFDNNYYTQRTLTSSKYFDLSTKGLLNQIEYELERKNFYSETKSKVPNHLSTKNNQFDIGF
ncbi:hypothetical protein F6Y05_36345 [Bacillus megaterium]|nr:hypothetical protein [Priestia megaterium]